MEKTAVEFIFDAVYRDITFSELLGIIAQAKIMEKQQDKNKYSEEDMYKAYHCGRLYQGREGDTTFEQFIRTI
jgi:hypothetical protein